MTWRTWAKWACPSQKKQRVDDGRPWTFRLYHQGRLLQKCPVRGFQVHFWQGFSAIIERHFFASLDVSDSDHPPAADVNRGITSHSLRPAPHDPLPPTPAHAKEGLA